jgi:hypothetical protein
MKMRFDTAFAAIRSFTIAIFASSVLPTAVLAESAMQPHTAEYRVKISIVGGRLSTEVKSTDSGYTASHVVSATGMSRILASGSISDTAEFDIAADGFRPVRLVSDDEISSDKIRAEIDFDWSSGEARGILNDEEYTAAIPDLAYDRISIQYQLMHDLRNGVTSGEYILFEFDELKTISVSNIGTRKVKVPAGEYNAVGIQHQTANSKRVTTLWCVEELGYLPVIIEQHRKGKLRLRATLERYTPTTS